MGVIDVLKKGMSTEAWGMRFYAAAAKRTQAADGKRVFESLEREEQSHLRILCAVYTTASSQECTYEQALVLAGQVEPSTVFPEAKSAGELIPSAFTDEQALAMAMAFEERGYALYKQAAEAASAPAERQMWGFLASAEDQHFDFIQKTREFLTSNGRWYFDEKELPFFEG